MQAKMEYVVEIILLNEYGIKNRWAFQDNSLNYVDTWLYSESGIKSWLTLLYFPHPKIVAEEFWE